MFDLNAYCVGHITDTAQGEGGSVHGEGAAAEGAAMDGAAGGIAAFPEGFTTEAEALGASLTVSASGFTAAEYRYTDPAMLRDLPPLDAQGPVRKVLDRVAEAAGIHTPAADCARSSDSEAAPRTVLLKVSGPYSVLASLVEPSLFYRWLRKEEAAVHGALEKITLGLAGYVTEALFRGARIISLVDSYGDPQVLGESHYREYAAAYLVRLLAALMTPPREGIIHLCPHNSVPLEAFGYLEAAAPEPASRNGPYIETLRAHAPAGTVLLAGHRCIYTAGSHTLRLFTIKRSVP
jgi:hypothetical protein